MKTSWFTFTILVLILRGNCDVDLGNYTASICREGTVNITWTPPSGELKYDFIDLYYTRKPEEGRSYLKINVINWIPSRGWQVTWNPKRFQGRLRAQSDSPTISFVLENVVRIDNGKYELSAVTKNKGRLHGVFTLIVYHEENYFPKLANADNSTSETDNTYTYNWIKSPESPSTGVMMKPRADDKELSEGTCYFGSQDVCEVEFTQEQLTDGRISFDVKYLFAESFSKCHTLDEPPTNLVIVIPYTGLAKVYIAVIILCCLAVVLVCVLVPLIIRQKKKNMIPYTGLAKVYIAVIILCCLAVVLICVLVPLIIRQKKKNKHKLSLRESLDFITKCIDHIQNYEEPADLKGVYRRTAQEKVVEAVIAEYKKKKGNDEAVNEFLSNVSKPCLASCIKHVLRTADQEWLSQEIQLKISNGELDANMFDAAAVRDYFRGSGRGKSQMKRDLLAAVFRHFDWFLKSTEEARKNVQLVDRSGLAVCISSDFFQAVKQPNQSMAKRWSDFVEYVLIHTDQVFPIEDDVVNAADHTGAPLIQRV